MRFVVLFQILKDFHNANHSHGDIHPGNLMLNNDGQVRLIDFGEVDKNENAVDKKYRAPEIMREKPGTLEQAQKAEVFSMGMVFLSQYLDREKKTEADVFGDTNDENFNDLREAKINM